MVIGFLQPLNCHTCKILAPSGRPDPNKVHLRHSSLRDPVFQSQRRTDSAPLKTGASVLGRTSDIENPCPQGAALPPALAGVRGAGPWGGPGMPPGGRRTGAVAGVGQLFPVGLPAGQGRGSEQEAGWRPPSWTRPRKDGTGGRGRHGVKEQGACGLVRIGGLRLGPEEAFLSETSEVSPLGPALGAAEVALGAAKVALGGKHDAGGCWSGLAREPCGDRGHGAGLGRGPEPGSPVRRAVAASAAAPGPAPPGG